MSPTPTSGPDELETLKRRVRVLETENLALRAEIADTRDSAGRFKALYDALPVSVYVLDKNGTIVGVNPYHLKTMGKGKTSLEDYVGKPAAARPSIMAAGMSSSVASVLRGESFEALDVYFPALSGGGEGWCDVRGVPLVSEGEIVGGIVMSMDVTDYHRAKDELSRHAERLERTLSGFIPICVSCKKIRDESGSWNQIEAYISARSEAEFSHSLCPDCVRKLYPDLKVES